MVARILGQVLLIFAALMLLPLIAGLCFGENVAGFAAAIAAAALAGAALLRFKPYTRAIFAREGFIAVGLSWLFMGLFGAIPFAVSGDIPLYADALFETVSGLTTTGASVVTDVERLSRAGLFWRSFLEWIGGMGILVFIMALLPMGGEHSMHIMRAELHCYLGLILLSTLGITLGITKLYDGIAAALRHAFFNTVSLMSTAAFATVDTMEWPQYARFILVSLMIIGGCAGSTSGGLKVSRAMLLFKTAAVDIAHIIHPREVRCVQMDGKRVDEATTKAVYCFFFLYFVIVMACAFVLSFDGHSFTTCLTASLSCMSNIGPSLSLVSTAKSYTIFSPFSRLTMMAVMLLGRLEIYPMLILASPSFWKRK